jgi:hypothetical protein
VVWLVCFSGVSVKLLLATSAFAIALMAQIPGFTSFSPGQGQSLEQGKALKQHHSSVLLGVFWSIFGEFFIIFWYRPRVKIV